jgi:hypothetical protein
MDAQAVNKIAIIKEVPFFGAGDTLETRLRKVTLRGFPGVVIYKDASFALKNLLPQEIPKRLYTPQPHVHQSYIDRINNLADLFSKEGIDIFQLKNAYDYRAHTPTGEVTEWTMLPPIVESFRITQHASGGFEYEALVGDDLRASLKTNGWGLNPAVQTADYHNKTDVFNLINDGSHRIHGALQKGKSVNIIQIAGMTPGFPYYAIPQHYSLVQVFPEEAESKDLKVHVVTSPGHKQLYRLFPSGGILSGSVRPARVGEVIA